MDIPYSQTQHSTTYKIDIDGKEYIKKIPVYWREYLYYNGIDHPNVIKPIKANEHEIITPYYDTCLNDLRTGVDSQTLYSVCKGLLEGLRCIHKHRIVHADIKPANVLLDGDQPIIIDFSSAIFFDDIGDKPLTSNGYEAPEIIQGGKYDAKIDVWGVGAIMLFLVQGKHVFLHNTIDEFMLSEEYDDSMRELGPLAPLVKEMLSMDYLKRPSPKRCLEILSKVEV